MTYGRFAFPLKVTWDITHKCNFRCSHCFVIYQNNISPLPRNSGIYNIIAKKILELRPFCVSISGGEPFLVNDLLDIASEFCANDIDVIIATNGSLLSQQRVTRLASMRRASLQISLDGPNSDTHDLIRGPGAFASAINALKVVRDRLSVTLAVTMTSRLVGQVGDIFDLAASHDVRRIKFQKMITSPSVPEKTLRPSDAEYSQLARALYPLIKANEGSVDVIHPFGFSGCCNEYSIGSCNTAHNLGVGLRECTVTPDGRLVTCGATIDEALHAESILDADSSLEAWHRLQLLSSKVGGRCLCNS